MFRTRVLTAIITAGLIVAALPAVAEDDNPHLNREGFFLGLDIGAGGSAFQYDKFLTKYESEDDDGGAAALRAGYALNPYFALAVEGRCYGHEGDDFDYSICSTTLLALIRPMGGGFYLRIGAGGTKVETEVHADSQNGTIEEFKKDGAIFTAGLGYEWMVSDQVGLGLSWNISAGGVEDFDAFRNVVFAESTLGLGLSTYF